MFRQSPVTNKRKNNRLLNDNNSDKSSDEGYSTAGDVGSDRRSDGKRRYQIFCKTYTETQKGRRSIKVIDDEPVNLNDTKTLRLTDGSRLLTRSLDDACWSDSGQETKPTRKIPLRALLMDDRPSASEKSWRTSSCSSTGRNVRLLTASSNSLKSSTSSLPTNAPTPYEQMMESRMQWHKEQQERQQRQLEHDSQVIDQTTGLAVGNLLALFMRNSVWPERSPLLVQFWVTQLSATYSLNDCITQMMIAKTQLKYDVGQSVHIFKDAPNIHIPLSLLNRHALLSIKALADAYSVRDCLTVLPDRGRTEVKSKFFCKNTLQSEGRCFYSHSGFRFDHVFDQMLMVSRVALVRDLSCEILRVGFRVLASSAALQFISCALQQAFCTVKQEMAPLEERALRGRTLDMYLTRKELEHLFYLQQHEQLLLTLIQCTHSGVLYDMTQQYVSRGELIKRIIYSEQDQ